MGKKVMRNALRKAIQDLERYKKSGDGCFGNLRDVYDFMLLYFFLFDMMESSLSSMDVGSSWQL